MARMRDRMHGMAKELGELRTQNRVLMLSQTQYEVKQNAISDIAKFVDKETMKTGNEGNRFRFMKFLDQLFETLMPSLEKIKVELVSYFDAVDLAYRARINALTKKSERFSPRQGTSPKAIEAEQLSPWVN